MTDNTVPHHAMAVGGWHADGMEATVVQVQAQLLKLTSLLETKPSLPINNMATISANLV